MSGRLALAFTAGMVATVNPCGFALLPAYLSYFLGLEGAADNDPGPRRPPVLRALAVSAAVTAGFLVVFGVMGLVWSSVSGVIGTRLPYFTMVVGVALVALGIAMLAGFEPVLRLPKVQLSRSGRELGSMFLYGVSYAIASLSCTIGVFIAVVSVSLDGGGYLSNVATFVAYGLGMGMTLSLLTIAVALARSGIVTAFRRVLPYVNRISGVLLVLAGVFVTYYAWVEVQELNTGTSSRVVQWSRDVQSALQRWVEQVGGARLAVGAAIVIVAAVAITLVARRPPAAPDGSTGGTADGGPSPADTDGGVTDGAEDGAEDDPSDAGAGRPAPVDTGRR